MIVLSLNCGSSSVKYKLYNWTKKEIIAKGIVERVTIGDSFCVHEVNHKEKITIEHDCPNHKEAISAPTSSVRTRSRTSPTAHSRSWR